MTETLEIGSINRTESCCALLELHDMDITEPDPDTEVVYEPGKAHFGVTNSRDQKEVETKLQAMGFRQIANWNNANGVRLNMWFRGPKGSVMQPFTVAPRAPARARVRARARRR